MTTPLDEAEAHAREVTRLLAECVSEKADLVQQLSVTKRILLSLVGMLQDDTVEAESVAELLESHGVISGERYRPEKHDKMFGPEIEISQGDWVYLIAPEWRVQP